MSDQPYRRYICIVCGYIYDEAEGDPDGDLPPGTRFEDIPEDWYCPICGVTKADFELLEDTAPPPAAAAQPPGEAGPSDDPNALVIVGAGVAGWSTAEAYRREDPNRRIVLVTADGAPVYPKPALSNALQQGRSPDEIIETSGQERARALGIQLRPFTRVLSVDASRQRLITASGGIPYGDLVLATGARPSVPPLAGDGVTSIHTVNDLESYRHWSASLGDAQRITVLGTGLVGTEMAEDLNAAGYEVIMADPAPTPLRRFLPEALGRQLVGALTAAGVDVRCGTTVARVERRAGGDFQLTDEAGETWTSDRVLSATGLKPVLDLAQSAGAAVGHGVQVDQWLRTSVDHIYAVGDGAEVAGRCYAFIEPIQRQARALAATLAGTDAPFEALPPMIRVKTPSLPLAVCPPPADDGIWHESESRGTDRLLVHYTGDALDGFAASGEFTKQASDLYQRIREQTQAALRATAS
jgi:rubredoxin-NAD+ reductase